MPLAGKTSASPNAPSAANGSPSRTRWALVALVAVGFLAAPPSVLRGQGPGPGSPSLEQRLLQEDPADLAEEARRSGDPARGAIVFYQPYLTCTRCHLAGAAPNPLGPDLSRPDASQPFDGAYLVEAVLQPSKAIRKGYEAVVVVTDRGKTITGLLVEETSDRLRLRDPAVDGRIIEVSEDAIEERMAATLSVMPAGMVNTLSSRQQFLDLVRYLIEIAEQGPERARELEPPPQAYAAPAIPEYEQRIDHAGIIADLDEAAFARGASIYHRLCVNCHGTADQPGSLPTSLRFAADPFKNGFDPHAMYRTLTRGFGMMMPQTWMVPQQKYDAIHYIREDYLRGRNPSQYFPVDRAYLASLPAGDTRGPEPSNFEPWVAMDYGTHLTATYEIGSDGRNFAYKGIAVRLDPGPGGISRGSHWMVYDEDTLRMAAAWSGQGFIDWDGILFNGRHGVHPRIVGQVHLQNAGVPGWGRPEDGSFDEVRLRGRDGRAYGPLPRAWAHYRGLYRWGPRVLLAYRVGDTEVLETPGAETVGTSTVWTRTFQIGPRTRDLVLQVAEHPRAAAGDQGQREGRYLVLGDDPPAAAGDAAGAPVTFDGATCLEIARSEHFDLTHSDYSICARIRTTTGGSLFCQTQPGSPWVHDGKSLFIRGGQLVFDIGWVGGVTARRPVADGAWHDVTMSWQQETGRVRLYVDGRLEGEGTLRPRGTVPGQVVRIGFTADNFPQPQTFFEGEIQELRFYRRVLADEQTVRPAWPQDVALVGRWEPSAARGGTVADATGGGHEGRVVGGQTVSAAAALVVGVDGLPDVPAWRLTDGRHVRLVVPAGDQPRRMQVWFATAETAVAAREMAASRPQPEEVLDLAQFIPGGPPSWPDRLTMPIVRGDDTAPFAVDLLSHPEQNPWLCQQRFTGIDFLPGGDRAAVCSWDGDVWLVSGIDQPEGDIVWQRIASGLFQPLGLKVVDGAIYVACRDQIVVLRDLNGDGETDFYENFNNDHQVTEHFHEFAMGLQTDAQGNFYYAKGARHGLEAVVPHHGTLLRVLRDGSRTEIVERGFRAPNGVCVNPDGTFIVTDQEGHWTPENRINWLRGDGRFWGNFWAFHDVADPADEAMEQPLCWIENSLDRSPAELVWVDSPAWGPLHGALLNLSYGYGKIYVVPHERIGDRWQGGMSPLPLGPFPTGVMRGRFHPRDGQLYACGMYAWAGNQQQPGGLYRIRWTGRPACVPLGLRASRSGMEIAFSDALDPDAVADPRGWTVTAWDIRRSSNYGSERANERRLEVRAARLADDRRTVQLEIPEIQPTWCMEIRYRIRAADGTVIESLIQNTIHALGD